MAENANAPVEVMEQSVHEQFETFLENGNSSEMKELLDSLSLSEGLREILNFSAEDRDRIFHMLPADTAADLIREAPNEVAVELVERLDLEVAAHIIEELDSDIQADVIGEMDDDDAEAILSEMDKEEADDVRRLVTYDDDTAGGIMVAESFTFKKTDIVGAVLKRLASDEEDFERYRGQHPYIVDRLGKPVGVVSLRGLLTAKKSSLLTEIMVKPMTVNVNTRLDELRDVFDEHPFSWRPGG